MNEYKALKSAKTHDLIENLIKLTSRMTLPHGLQAFLRTSSALHFSNLKSEMYVLTTVIMQIKLG
jgi:hypothetical protein